MTASGAWQRRIALRLVRHAARVLRTARPEWSEALESELNHVPGHYRALMWAIGCVRASYRERYLDRSRPLLAAIAVGLVFALLDEFVSGTLAAVAWPQWYVAFAGSHRHLSLELWSIVAVTLPIALLAAGSGALLARVSNTSRIMLPWASIGVWVIYLLVPTPGPCVVALRVLWEDLVRSPTSSIAGVVLPGCALIVGFRRTRILEDRNPPATTSEE
jgi:hypothetical protein